VDGSKTQLTFNLQPERRIYTVSDLTVRIRELLAKNFTDVTVQGEISNCRAASSGHYYFTLKDERAQVRCVLFKQQQRGMKFLPEDGIKVTVRGSVSVYEARGEYQIYVESIEPAGRGALQLAFEQLKKRLEAEGLFDTARKKPLPLLPNRIGLITSPTGAAVRDVVRILKRRFHNVHLTLYPVRVQGEGSAAEIVAALGYFNKKLPVDVILLDTTFWGGIRPCIKAAGVCETFQLGVAVHSSGELGIQLATMLHLGAVIPNLSFAADAHYHHLEDDIIAGGKFQYEGGSVAVPRGPGLGVKLDYDKLSGYKELHKRLGPYPYDQDPLRPGWTYTSWPDRRS